jgi:hypothetical protein
MTLSSLAPENLARPSDFKALRYCFLRFASCNRLWHKEPGKYALGWTWQAKFGGREGRIAAKERKDRKERRLDMHFRSHCVLLDLKLVAAEVD